MTLYVETMSNRSKLEKKQSFGYSNENFSVSKNNQKCTIDTINNQYLLVTYVGEKEKRELILTLVKKHFPKKNHTISYRTLIIDVK